MCTCSRAHTLRPRALGTPADIQGGACAWPGIGLGTAQEYTLDRAAVVSCPARAVPSRGGGEEEDEALSLRRSPGRTISMAAHSNAQGTQLAMPMPARAVPGFGGGAVAGTAV